MDRLRKHICCIVCHGFNLKFVFLRKRVHTRYSSMRYVQTCSYKVLHQKICAGFILIIYGYYLNWNLYLVTFSIASSSLNENLKKHWICKYFKIGSSVFIHYRPQFQIAQNSVHSGTYRNHFPFCWHVSGPITEPKTGLQGVECGF